MSEELKPCPACGSISISRASTTPVYYCVCNYCNMYGPESMRQEESIAAWNALPRRLKWTREKPIEEGWYWLKEEGRRVVAKMTAGGMISEPYVRHVNDVDGEWAGPIQEPE